MFSFGKSRIEVPVLSSDEKEKYGINFIQDIQKGISIVQAAKYMKHSPNTVGKHLAKLCKDNVLMRDKVYDSRYGYAIIDWTAFYLILQSIQQSLLHRKETAMLNVQRYRAQKKERLQQVEQPQQGLN